MGGGVSSLPAEVSLAEAKELAGARWQPAWEEKFAEAKISRDEAIQCWKESKAAISEELYEKLHGIDRSSVAEALDFSAIVNEKRGQHLPGTREWVFEAVLRWRTDADSAKLFWVVGGGGTGKSVAAAELLARLLDKQNAAAWHFCKHTEPARSAPTALLRSLAGMLCATVEGFEDALKESAGVESDKVDELFEALVAKPLRSVKAPRGADDALVLVIDALDELPRDALKPVLLLLATELKTLPPWIKLVVTSRDEAQIKSAMSGYTPSELRVDEARNRQDVRAYLTELAKEHVELEVTMDSLRHEVEAKFPGLKNLDTFADLEDPLRRSKGAYDEAVRGVAGIHELEKYKERRLDLIQDETDFDKLYADAALAQTILVDALKTLPGDVSDPGVKGRGSAERKLADKYTDENGVPHPEKFRDLARATVLLSEDGKTILYHACENGSVDAAQLLLDKGAEVDRDKDGRTPLYAAFEKGHIDAAQLLLERGAKKVDQADEDGRTLLYMACESGQIDAARLLLDNGAEVDRATKDGRTPLYLASTYGRVDAARLLLDKGADVNKADEDSATPLLMACLTGHVDAARLLLDNGAKVDRAEKQGATPLFAACQNGHVDAARLLLDNSAAVDRAMNEGATPLAIAKQQGHSAVVALLEEHLDSKFPLHAAARTGNVEAMTQLLDGGAATDQTMGNGETPLWIACQVGQADAARLLLERGAEVDRTSTWNTAKGVTSLMVAALGSHIDVMRLLLERGAEMDMTESYGNTALMFACYEGHIDAARLLLGRGADITRAATSGPGHGMDALALAKHAKRAAVVALLEEHQK